MFVSVYIRMLRTNPYNSSSGVWFGRGTVFFLCVAACDRLYLPFYKSIRFAFGWLVLRAAAAAATVG